MVPSHSISRGMRSFYYHNFCLATVTLIARDPIPLESEGDWIPLEMEGDGIPTFKI